MKKGLLVLLVLFISLATIIYADNDNNSNNQSNNTNGDNQNVSCVEDEDCTNLSALTVEWECEDGFCVIDDEEEDEENESEENETEEDEIEDEENEIKVCCMVTKTKEEIQSNEFELEREVKYKWSEEEDCISKNQSAGIKKSEKAIREIVNDSFCGDIKEAVREKNRIKFEERTGQECLTGCICTGVVMKCLFENGTKEMTVYTGSGNIIFQVKEINATTSVTLYHYNGKTYGNFSEGITEIKILPDEIKEKIKEKKKIEIEQEEIELDEDGAYKVEAKKKARFFFILPVKEKVHAEMSSENGEILKFKGSWWGFLARDIKEE